LRFLLRSVLLAAGLAIGLAPLAMAQSLPRTPWGKPDFQGEWTNASLTTLERPDVLRSLVVSPELATSFEASHPRRPFIPNDAVGQGDSEIWELTGGLARVNGEIRSAWIVDPPDGKLPFTPAGRARIRGVLGVDNPEERTLGDRCLPDKAGPPMLNGNYNNRWRFVQTPEFLVVLMEHQSEVRIIRIGDQKHLPDVVRPWKGDSIAHWDGDALVIETTNLNARQAWRRHALWNYYVSEKGVVTERISRSQEGQLLYEFVVDDPDTYTQRWTGHMPLRITSEPMYEYACHEGNYSMANILAGGRRSKQ